jgi:hypothetical protein
MVNAPVSVHSFPTCALVTSLPTSPAPKGIVLDVAHPLMYVMGILTSSVEDEVDLRQRQAYALACRQRNLIRACLEELEACWRGGGSLVFRHCDRVCSGALELELEGTDCLDGC